MILRRVLLCCFVSLLLMGCAHGRLQMATEEFKGKYLSFIENGKTTKEEILLKLGVPSAKFEGERILTYKLILDENENLLVVDRDLDITTIPFGIKSSRFPIWGSAEYNLVLIFDEQHMLQKHALLKVK